jgi:hypothetical protein
MPLKLSRFLLLFALLFSLEILCFTHCESYSLSDIYNEISYLVAFAYGGWGDGEWVSAIGGGTILYYLKTKRNEERRWIDKRKIENEVP